MYRREIIFLISIKNIANLPQNHQPNLQHTTCLFLLLLSKILVLFLFFSENMTIHFMLIDTDDSHEMLNLICSEK